MLGKVDLCYVLRHARCLDDPRVSRSGQEAFFHYGTTPKSGWQQVTHAARRKLDMLDAASKLSDLRAPPNNHLEALKSDRLGQHSIRINRKWRLCFVWTDNGPDEVEVVDYH